MEMALRQLLGTPLAHPLRNAPKEIQNGSTVLGALQPGRDLFPNFFLPVIDAAERTGRLDEAFTFLEHHCRMLERPILTVRRFLLYPLMVLAGGQLVQVALELFFLSASDALSTAFQFLAAWCVFALVVAVFSLTPLSAMVQGARLFLPLVGTTERDLAVCRFFRVLELLYSISDLRVEKMIQIAAGSTGNQILSRDFRRAADAIENHDTVSGAFQHVRTLDLTQWSVIDTGDESGTLEKSFEMLSVSAGDRVVERIRMVEPIMMRLVVLSVIFSLVMTMMRIASRI